MQLGTTIPDILRRDTFEPLVFSDSYNIHNPFVSKLAIRATYIDRGKTTGPFFGHETLISDWLFKKSVSAKKGIYGVPIETFKDDNFYAEFIMFNACKNAEKTLLSLLDYTSDDVIYETYDKVSEVCLRSCNIVFSALADDFFKRQVMKGREYRLEMLKLMERC